VERREEVVRRHCEEHAKRDEAISKRSDFVRHEIATAHAIVRLAMT
jgi:hypothetical protein